MLIVLVTALIGANAGGLLVAVNEYGPSTDAAGTIASSGSDPEPTVCGWQMFEYTNSGPAGPGW